jgi:hypothetical protein
MNDDPNDKKAKEQYEFQIFAGAHFIILPSNAKLTGSRIYRRSGGAIGYT